MIPAKVISGGQTGVDRAGLDVSLEAGIPVGGYCPKGRLAEDGTIPDRYPLTELPVSDYAARTEQNVLTADGTLILNLGVLTGGTSLTRDLARVNGKPCLVVQLEDQPDPGTVSQWLMEHSIRVLNIAGPRESIQPGVHDRAVSFLRLLFQKG